MNSSAPNSSNDSHDDLQLANLIEELSERLKQGEQLDSEAVTGQYPQFTERLRKLFPTILALATIEPTTGSSYRLAALAGDAALGVGTIGDYQIIRQIGRGGMGIVYEASQTSLNRRVALKVLPFAAALDPKALARFRQESLAAAQLDHPHIVHVYNVGVDRGTHYYAMQYIEGQSLADVISEMKRTANPVGRMVQSSRDSSGNGLSDFGSGHGAEHSSQNSKSGIQIPDSRSIGGASRVNAGAETRPVAHVSLSTDRGSNPKEFYRSVARLAIQAAEALDYAHEQGILHRDVKPGNILLDDAGDVWIADFGLARIGNEGNLTRTGDLIGTLRYASPEQVLAERGLIDQRSDIYSLGATFYEVLTGRPVFFEDDRKRLLKQITDGEPLSPRRIDASIPCELETIVLKCLEKDPPDRYQTARDVATDLKHYLAYEPLVVRRAGLFERLGKWSRRHQAWVLSSMAATMVATLCLATSTIWVVHEHDQTARAREAAATQKGLAAARQEYVRRDAYVNDIHRADDAWKRCDFTEARRLLDAWRPQAEEEDLRGFEWYLLSRIVREAPQAWRRHQGECYCARFSPDGTMLATSGQDGVRIWNWPAGDQIARLTSHTADVNGVAFSPDGSLLATASDDRTVKLFDTRDWTERHTIPHPGDVIGVVFSLDGSVLFSAHKRRNTELNKTAEVVSFWKVADGTEQSASVALGWGDIQGIAISPDGRLLGLAGDCARFWDLAAHKDGILDLTVSIYNGVSVRSVAFAHHHPLWAASDERGVVSVYNTAGGRLENYLNANKNGVESVSFCPHDDALVSASRDGTVRLWEFVADRGNALHETATYRGTGSLWCAVFSPDGNTIVATGGAGDILLFRRDRWQECRSFNVPPTVEFTALTYSPDGRFLAWIGYDGVSLLEVGLEPASVHLLPREGNVSGIAFASDGMSLLVELASQRVEAWDTKSGQRTAVVHKGPRDSATDHAGDWPEFERPRNSRSADGRFR
ncbi:MAG: protein kinase, partial [Planctomycetia bacterium]|nr:protein kinase [Planctomycetia bacterium]